MHRYAFLALLLTAVAASADDPKPQQFRYQVTGLFARDREPDLREVFENLPGFKLVSIDFDNAEIAVEYDPKTALPGAKPDQYVPQFDNKLRQATRGTFGIKPLRTVPRDKLEAVEITIGILDCKACGLAVYEMVNKVDGVALTTVDYKAGKVTAWGEPGKADREKIEAVLKQRNVPVKPR